jgi:U6 snRNA-associated Sm-like protein LSm6
VDFDILPKIPKIYPTIEFFRKNRSKKCGDNLMQPLQTLEKSVGKSITIRLKSNQFYTGRLRITDQYMNLILEDCSEMEDGKIRKRYGQAFLRGNNILYIKLD